MEIFHKVVWIIGASSGIGKELAIRMGAMGGRLILSSRREDALAEVRTLLPPDAAVHILPLDLTDPTALEPAVGNAITRFGHIDMVVYSAGVSQFCSIQDSTQQIIRKLMEVNFFGIADISRQLLSHFKERHSGVFMVINSVTGLIGFPMKGGYSASKHALDGFFTALQAETWEYGIRVLKVYPLAIKTNIAQNFLGTTDTLSEAVSYVNHGMPVEKCVDQIMGALHKNRDCVMPGHLKEKWRFRFYARWFKRVHRYVKYLKYN